MNSLISELPTLGVGTSLSLTSDPDPVELASLPGGPSFIEYAGQVDPDAVLEEVNKIHATGTPVLFHPAYLNFCGSFPNDPAWLEETARHVESVNSPWLAQDLAYCFWQEGPGYSTQLGYFLPPVFNQSSLDHAIARVQEVQAIVPTPIAIEPPPMTFFAGSMALLSFIGELATATDCAVLLDMGHLVSYEMASGRKIADEIADFPWQRVIEIHLAGGRIEKPGQPPFAASSIYVDAHEEPIQPATWAMFSTLVPHCSNLKAVCFECEGSNVQTVLSTLKKIRSQVVDQSSNPALVDLLHNQQTTPDSVVP